MILEAQFNQKMYDRRPVLFSQLPRYLEHLSECLDVLIIRDYLGLVFPMRHAVAEGLEVHFGCERATYPAFAKLG